MSKKLVLIAGALGLLAGGLLFSVFHPQQNAKAAINDYHVLVENPLGSEIKPLTILEAWDMVFAYAQGWSEDALLITLESSDVGDNDPDLAGLDGKRRTWYASFTSSKLNRQLYIQLTDGVIVVAIEDGFYDPSIPVISSKPAIDSPKVLALVISNKPGFSPGEDKGRGYHFILRGGSNDKPLFIVTGSVQVTGLERAPAMATLDLETGQIEAQYYTVAPTGGILFSPDAGSTWQSSNLINQMILGLARHPENPEVAYAVAVHPDSLVLFETTNSGMTWFSKGYLPAEAGNWAYGVRAVNVANEHGRQTYLLVGTRTGLWVSTGENDWKRSPGLPVTASGPLAVIQEDQGVRIFCVVSGPELYKSTIYSSRDLIDWTIEVESGVFRLSESYNQKYIAVTDEFQEFALLFNKDRNKDILKVPLGTLRLAGDFSGHGRLLLDGPENGLHVNESGRVDSTDWMSVLPESLGSIAVSPDQSSMLAGGFRTGIFRSTNGGDTWEKILDDPSLIVAGSNEIPSILFLTNENVIAVNGGRLTWVSY